MRIMMVLDEVFVGSPCRRYEAIRVSDGRFMLDTTHANTNPNDGGNGKSCGLLSRLSHVISHNVELSPVDGVYH